MDVALDKSLGCLIGGLIGDAMGNPTEGKTPEQIEAVYGWVEDFDGDGTDDSIMKHILAEALIGSNGYATIDDWAEQWWKQRALIRSKQDRFFVSVQQTARKLRHGYSPRMCSFGNMASSSSAMCIAPVGIVNAAHPRAAATQAEELASLIHTGDVSFCQDAAAAVAAAVAAGFSSDATTDSVLDAATAYLKPTSGKVMKELIADAIALARRSGEYKEFRQEFYARFRQSNFIDSRETVPAAFGIVCLADGDPKRAIEYGANFGRDADTIATMSGAICGAMKGARSLPKRWIEKAESNSDRDQRALARALLDMAREKARSEAAAWRSTLSVLEGG